MFTGFIKFLATKFGVSTLIVELVLGLGCAGGVYWWLKHHDAQIAHEYRQIGVQETIKDYQKLNDEQQKKKDEEIKILKENAEKKIVELQKMNADLALAKSNVEKRLTLARNNVIEKIVEIPVKVSVIPPDQLVDNIRQESAKLADLPIETIIPTGILIEAESRRILGQLQELDVRRAQLKEYEGIIIQYKDNEQKSTAACSAALTLEKQNTIIAQKQRDSALERAQFWESSYKIVTKKTSLKCKIWRFFTLGTSKCGKK